MLFCPVCKIQFEKQVSLSHHLCSSHDEEHIKFINDQRNLAKKMFETEKNIDDLILETSDFKLTRKFLKRFWGELFTENEIKERGFRIIKNHHRSFNITKEELYDLYINKKMTDVEISKIFNTKAANITYLRKQYEIGTIENWERKELGKVTERERSIFLGMMLGDGYVKKSNLSKYSCFATKHSVKQYDYLNWLYNELKRWITDCGIRKEKTNPHPVTGKLYQTYYFESINHPFFEELHKLFYIKNDGEKNRTKILNFEYIKKYFTDLSLAVWIMDDGSCAKDTGCIRIYTNSFSEEEVCWLINFIYEKYNVSAKIIKIKNKDNGKIYPIIKFNKSEAIKIAKIIEPYVIESMKYKIEPTFLKNNINIRKDNKEELFNNNSVNIFKEKWEKINMEHDKKYIKNKIISEIINKKIEFPYREITLDSIIKETNLFISNNFKNLFSVGEFNTKFDYKYNIKNEYIDSTNIGNNISNYFQQKNRYSCAYKSRMSPQEIWNCGEELYKILNFIFNKKFDSVNGVTLRDMFRLKGYTASQFKPSVAKYIYNTYGNKGDVLDFSAGWGDRLAGFYASDCKSYVGIDPNKKVYDKYFEQSVFYEKFVHKDVSFINQAAEDVNLGDKKFDLIFTSPPYFNTEQYTNDENQSWIRYKNFDIWLNQFLFKTIGNFWGNLKVGGKLIINISDVNNKGERMKICDPMNDWIATLSGAKYDGAIGMKLAKRPNSSHEKEKIFCEPIWIWTKDK